MKNKLNILLTLTVIMLASLTTSANAYWVDRDGYRHEGVVSGSVGVADDAVADTGYVLGGLFGEHRHYYDGPSDHYCRHHPYDRAC